MARGREGSFGGKTLLKPYVWLAFCLVFLLGLADLRRPLSLRNFDLLVLLSFSVSLAFFDRGEIFRSVPLVYPVLGYFLVRSAWVGIRKSEEALRPVWPTWAFAAAAVFLLGFRVGLNVETPRGVIDVGLAGRRRRESDPRRRGAVREHAAARRSRAVRAEGRRRRGSRAHTDERALRGGDRAGGHVRAGLLCRVPPRRARVRVEREVGLAAGCACDVDPLRRPDHLRAGARRSSLRGSAPRRCARVRLVRVSVHRVRPERQHERHDHAALLVFGFWLASSAWARGSAVALAGWAKFGGLLLAPLWASAGSLPGACSSSPSRSRLQPSRRS